MKNKVKNNIFIMLCIIQINSIFLTAMIPATSNRLVHSGTPAFSMNLSRLINTFSNENDSAVHTNYNPQMINFNSQTITPSYSVPKENHTKYQQQKYNIDDSKAFADVETAQESKTYNPWTDHELGLDSMDEPSVTQPQQTTFNPKLSISQNLYGKKPGFTNSTFGVQKRDYSTFKPISNDSYDILGIPRTATSAEIKTAYKNLVKQYHPDVNLDNKKEATEALQKINNAYDQITNPSPSNVYTYDSDSYQPHPMQKERNEYNNFRYAVMNKNMEEIKKFIKNGIDMNNTYGLHFVLRDVIIDDDFEMMKFLVEAQGNIVNKIDESGMTPLEYAILFSRPKEIQYLIQKGADVNHRINVLIFPDEAMQRKSLLDMAIRYADPEIISLLRQAGAKTAKELDMQKPIIIKN